MSHGTHALERVNDARARGILEAALDAIIVIDAEGRITESNLAAERILGWLRSDLVGRMLQDTVIPPRYRGAHQRAFAQHIRTGIPGILGQRLELHARRADGSEFPCELIVTRVDLADEVIFAGHIRDISDRREAERAIRESEARLRTLTEAMPEAVFLFDAEGRMVIANPAALELTATGSPLHFAGLVGRLDTGEDTPPAISLGQRMGPLEARLAPRGRWVEWSSHPVEVPPDTTAVGQDASSGTGGAATMVVLRDVTEQRQARVTRDAFIGVLSHELRTPVTTLYGTANLLTRAGRLDDDVRDELVRDMLAEADRLQRLVEDLLVLSRAELGRIEVVPEPILMQRLIPRLVSAEEARWPATRFHFDIAQQLPPVVGDETYLSQALRNLIGNAAKYSPVGSQVQVHVESQDGDVVVRVLDEGPGFPPEEAERLFELFYRSARTAQRATGAGIGLFVTKQLVEALGGTAWAVARPGGGSEFGLRLRPYTEDL